MFSVQLVDIIVFIAAIFLSDANCQSHGREYQQLQGFSGRHVGSHGPQPPFSLSFNSSVDPEHDNSNCLTRTHCPSFFEQRYPTIDGTCNNRVRPRRGSADQTFRRILKAEYSDIDMPRLDSMGDSLASARAISNAIQQYPQLSSEATQMLPFFGQFLAHDLTLTLAPEEETINCSCSVSSAQCLNIPIPRSDQQYSAEKTCFMFERSLWGPNSDDCSLKTREQINELSAFIDTNIIYGNSEEEVLALREQSADKPGEIIMKDAAYGPAGKLLPQTGDSDQLKPAEDQTFCPHKLIKPKDFPCFISGEPRTNENSALASHHTIWTRLHNLIVKGLKEVNPLWDSDKLFNSARGIVIALFQKVTYEHFLPQIIGPQQMRMFDLNLLSNGYYYGYDSSVDATVINSFATAAFRLGHPLINMNFIRPDPTYTKQQGPTIRVKDALNNPGVVAGKTPGTETAGGPNSFIRGLAAEPALKFDTTIPDDLRNFLDAETGKFGSDLLARNIQRGRDHGLPSYVKYREFCGLFVPKSFKDMSSFMEQANINNLKIQYKSVEDIDLFPGGTAEKPLKDGTVGPTFACIIGYQFRAVKKGDRFWHENPPPFGMFTKEQLFAIRQYSFPGILCDSVNDMLSIQPWPLKRLFGDNQRMPCEYFQTFNFTAWQENPTQSDNPPQSVLKQDTEWTMWFPLKDGQSSEQLSVSEMYNWLVVNRPDQVCSQVLRTEIRPIRTHETQVRFECLPGTIKYSDFPLVPSGQYYWTKWTTKHLPQRNRCPSPFAIQAQTRPSEGVTVPAGLTNEVFSQFNPRDGLVCDDRQQEDGKCQQYFFRYLCRESK